MSDKSKRKVKPEHFTRLQKFGIAVIICLLFMFFVSWQSRRNFEPPISESQATLIAQVMASGTQTAISLEADGCEMVDITGWRLNIVFDNHAEIDIRRSNGEHVPVGSNWFCDDGYRFQHTEYYINVFY